MPANPLSRHLPALSILLGASMWGVIWYPMRLLEAHGLAGVWLTLILYATALIASLPFTYRALAEFARRPGLLLLFMLASGWTNIAFVEAALTGNILRVLLLFYLSPLWAVLLGWLILRERLERAALFSLLLAMSGALIMLWNPRLGAPWPHGSADWFALSAGFAFAFSNVLARKMDDISTSARSIGVWAGVVLVALPMLVFLDIDAPVLTNKVIVASVALGLFGILVMTALMQYGVARLPVYRTAILTLIELVVGAVSQQLLTEEVVSAREWAGGVLILLGAWLSARTTLTKPS